MKRKRNRRQHETTNHANDGKQTLLPSPDVRTVNIHITRDCNLKCRFCFATFRDVDGCLGVNDWRRILEALAAAGTQKVNFAGGEPTLFPDLGVLLREVKRLGMTSSIVTNGFRLEGLLEDHGRFLDWVGLSVDSAYEKTQKKLGRGNGLHVQKALELASNVRAHGCHLKLNTVVTSLNCDEDMSAFVHAFAPDRWKVFQVLRIDGQNDTKVGPLLITEAQFQGFVRRHLEAGITVIDEDNDAMLESYVMVDPRGRFFSDSGQRHTYSDPILDVGVDAAYQQVIHRPEKTIARGGIYDWGGTQRAPFVVIEGLDGVGKSTVARGLAERLQGQFFSTPGEHMKELRWTVHKALGDDPNALCALYLATVLAEGRRAETLRCSGTPVVMDRYWLSTVAYGGARGAKLDLSSAASAVAAPDLTVVLELEENQRRRRLRERDVSSEDRLTFESRFSEHVRSTMRSGQPRELGPVSNLEVTELGPDEVLDRIMSELELVRRPRLPVLS